MKDETKIIDFHAHILPGADHGSDGMEMTAKQMALMNDAGVDTVVATPHFYPNRHSTEFFIQKISESADKLVSAEIERPKLCIGTEVLFCDGLDRMENLNKLCIRGTDVLLLELPNDRWEMPLLETVKRLTKNYTVVLAHIDRYIEHREAEIDYLLEIGALAQINASSLFSFSVKRKLKPYVNDGLICAIGSDIHEVDKKVCKHFTGAQKKLGDEYFAIMERSQKLLDSAELF